MSNWKKLLNWKGARTYLFKRFLKIIAQIVYFHQMAKFGEFKRYIQKDIVLFTNTRRDITNLVNHGMVEYRKTWICREQNRTFLRNKKILNLCLRWHILRSYCFVVEVTFKWHAFSHRTLRTAIIHWKCLHNLSD